MFQFQVPLCSSGHLDEKCSCYVTLKVLFRDAEKHRAARALETVKPAGGCKTIDVSIIKSSGFHNS